jgi:nitrate/TMAO reductase-like tetraheme cytochrome c subunit
MLLGQVFRAGIVVLLMGACVSAVARDNVWNQTEDNAVWRSECGACHMAFPPGMLASDDWLAIMAQLDKHFGVDASLESSIAAEISDYLKRQGASNRFWDRHEEAPRITTSERFEHKHRGAIRLWRKGQLQSLSDCGACHKETATK